MKTRILFILLLASFIFLSAYERDQVSHYAHRYTRLTEGKCEAVNIFPDSIYYNVNPFIISLEGGSGYHPIADCAHFVSQCLQAGGIQMYENNYSDNPDFLGCVGCRGLNIQAKNNFADSLRMTFHDSLWITEVIEPNFENDHYTSTNYDIFFYVPREVRLINFHFNDFNLHPGFPPYQPDRVTIGQYPYWFDDLVITGNQGNFWSGFLYRYAYLQNQPYVHLEYHPDWNGYYGFQMNSLKWQSYLEPDSDYQQGDFQIFCNYRTGNIYTQEDQSFSLHYENTYNDSGRTIRYRHAAVCRSGSGNTARVSAHNSDRNDSLWTYSYCPDSEVDIPPSRNSISFYHINDGTGGLPNLCAYNNWGSNSIITTSDPASTTDLDYFEAGDPVYIKYSFQNNGNVMIPDRFQVRIEYENTRTLIDSVLYNGIFSGSNVIDTLVFGMPDVDSLTINIKLDAGDSLDYGADWERTWSEQNWVEESELDNTISKTIYLGLQPPINLEIEITPNRGTIDINWYGDITSTYKVYSSSDPYSGFEEDLTGSYSGTSWSAPLPSENRFYYVVKTDGRESTRSRKVRYRKVK